VLAWGAVRAPLTTGITDDGTDFSYAERQEFARMQGLPIAWRLRSEACMKRFSPALQTPFGTRRWLPLRLSLVVLLLLAGCSAAPEREVPPRDACGELTSALDRAISAESYFDPSLRRITGWPLGRADRFLAGFEYDTLTPAAREAWLEHTLVRARDAYVAEFARLSPDTRRTLRTEHGFEDVGAQLEACFLRSSPPVDLPEASYAVPDSYSDALRVVGLYPLTGLVARGFIERYRDAMTARVEAGPATVFEAQQSYAGAQGDRASIAPELPLVTDALGVPRWSDEHWQALFRQHMPQIVSELRSDADRVGTPGLDADSRIRIDTGQPTVFTYPGYMRRGGQVLAQLNYVFWFPARTPERGFDLYAGDLAGILWRVTLDHGLRPVLYDSIHLCGCYHKLFLPPGSQIDLDRLKGERPLVFALDDLPEPPRGLRLRLAAATHYIIEVRGPEFDPEALSYRLEPYARQLTLPGPAGVVSLFGSTGIVEQSRRPERFVLWPMGIRSPGAMRQRGLHATAFAGRRHFDAADLLDTLGLTFD
jgi:hypothetical protein